MSTLRIVDAIQAGSLSDGGRDSRPGQGWYRRPGARAALSGRDAGRQARPLRPADRNRIGSCRRLVCCAASQAGGQVGAAGTIVATADGGRTWRAQANPLRGSSTPLYAIACVAPSSCYVIARPDAILVTHDGGASWSRHLLSVGVSGADLTDQECLPFYAPADCPTSTDCYIDTTNPFGADRAGVGQGWPGSIVLNAIARPAALTCYLAGSGGSIGRITNGTTLTAQRTPTSRDLYGVDCPGPATCYAVGDDGTILALGWPARRSDPTTGSLSSQVPSSTPPIYRAARPPYR